MIRAADGFVRVIIRRPHAYRFRETHAGAPIPGLAFLGPDGKMKGGFVFEDASAKAALLAKLNEMR